MTTEKHKKILINILCIACLTITLITILTAIILITRQKTNSVQNPTTMDPAQCEYVVPETPFDRSKVVTMPGWGSYSIPANTTEITKGFEFHNPKENFWYEIQVSYNNEFLENIVVDSDTKVDLTHYLKLAGISAIATGIEDYDSHVFSVEKK